MDIDAAARFAALADPARLLTVEILTAGPATAGALARRLAVSPSVMSRHLRTLQEAGLVTDRRDPVDARRRLVTLRPEGLAAARAWMDQVQARVPVPTAPAAQAAHAAADPGAADDA